jgi:hypothetical protein
MMISGTDGKPQFFERMTYLKSIVKILVFDIYILVCHLWQLMIYYALFITFVRYVRWCLWQFWKLSHYIYIYIYI